MSLHRGTSALMEEDQRNIDAGNLNKIEFEFWTFQWVAVMLRIEVNNFLQRKRRVLFCVILFFIKVTMKNMQIPPSMLSNNSISSIS